ncbi:MAG: hypothetical protein ACO3RV_06990, partial [Luteolibacter sp.]
LFHNGTWVQWREMLKRMPRHRLPDALLSDSRVAASLVDLCGMDPLDRLPGRWVIFERDFTELFGHWERFRGMEVSNLGFTHHLRRPRPFFAPKYTQSADSSHQSLLPLSGTCGNPGPPVRPHVPSPRKP